MPTNKIPKTMSAEREATLRPMPSHLIGQQQLNEVFKELDAEHAAHAETRERLAKVEEALRLTVADLIFANSAPKPEPLD